MKKTRFFFPFLVEQFFVRPNRRQPLSDVSIIIIYLRKNMEYEISGLTIDVRCQCGLKYRRKCVCVCVETSVTQRRRSFYLFISQLIESGVLI